MGQPKFGALRVGQRLDSCIGFAVGLQQVHEHLACQSEVKHFAWRKVSSNKASHCKSLKQKRCSLSNVDGKKVQSVVGNEASYCKSLKQIKNSVLLLMTTARLPKYLNLHDSILTDKFCCNQNVLSGP